MSAARPGVDDERRRRVRRFGLVLLAVVVLLVAFAIGYVELFSRVLRDPSRPPSVTSPSNPRVLLFELGLVAALVVGFTSLIVWRRHRGPR